MLKIVWTNILLYTIVWTNMLLYTNVRIHLTIIIMNKERINVHCLFTYMVLLTLLIIFYTVWVSILWGRAIKKFFVK